MNTPPNLRGYIFRSLGLLLGVALMVVPMVARLEPSPERYGFDLLRTAAFVLTGAYLVLYGLTGHIRIIQWIRSLKRHPSQSTLRVRRGKTRS